MLLNTNDNTIVVNNTIDNKVEHSTLLTMNSNKNIARLASPEELELNSSAIELFDKMFVQIDDGVLSSEFVSHLKPVFTAKRLSEVLCMINQFNQTKKCLDMNRHSKKLSIKRSTKMCYNKQLNSLLNVLSEDTILSNLLFVNEQLCFVSKKEKKQRRHVDFTDPFGRIVEELPYVLHTKGPLLIGGGRTGFDDPEECLSALRACMERCVSWKDHIVECDLVNTASNNPLFINRVLNKCLYGQFRLLKKDTKCYALKIPFVGTKYWELSDSSKLRHILC